MGASEKVEATFHPGRSLSPWTDEDVAAVARAFDPFAFDMVDVTLVVRKRAAHQSLARTRARIALSALAPRVDALVRAGQVEELRVVEEALLAPTPGRLVDAGTCRYWYGYVAALRHEIERGQS